MPINLQAVRFLTIREIAELWSPELGIPQPIVERELQISIINLAPDRDWREEGLIDEIPTDEDLPPVTLRIGPEHIRTFCEKQGPPWSPPTFWFVPDVAERRGRGRPTQMHELLEEMEERARRGELEDNVTDEARCLQAWAVASGLPEYATSSIRSKISNRYQELKRN